MILIPEARSSLSGSYTITHQILRLMIRYPEQFSASEFRRNNRGHDTLSRAIMRSYIDSHEKMRSGLIHDYPSNSEVSHDIDS